MMARRQAKQFDVLALPSHKMPDAVQYQIIRRQILLRSMPGFGEFERYIREELGKPLNSRSMAEVRRRLRKVLRISNAEAKEIPFPDAVKILRERWPGR